ncbi:MAG TPA: DUF4253 domain-containing protein [Verrucomicrobiae bacterium]|nr:DUF4253 domain-containing protein [Verrucomicrobiae bacterium]
MVFQPEASFEVASCPGESALGRLSQLRKEGRRSGFTVILLGSKDDAVILAENREHCATSLEKYLREAATLNVDKWLKEQVERDPGEYFAEIGEWCEMTPRRGISAHLETLSRKPRDAVYIARIPTSENWEAPAYIGLGGWNACPDASVLTALAKRWHKRYGAEILAITHDTMEFKVANPPASKERAIELAKEQFIACPDIVNQKAGTISALASRLINSNYWYFWWD